MHENRCIGYASSDAMSTVSSELAGKSAAIMKTAESAFLQAEIAQADSYVSFRGSHNKLLYAYAHQR